MSELCDLILKHCTKDLTPTAIPGLMLSRACSSTEPLSIIYYPLLCVVAKGRKRVVVGDEELFYDANSYLVASIDVPVSGQVVEAPCVGLVMALHPPTLMTLMEEMPSLREEFAESKPLTVNPLDQDLLDPLIRLMRLLDRPADIPIMAKLIEREILYRLLRGPRGGILRQLALPKSQLSQISKAIHQIRTHFNREIRVEELARIAGMSVTSFHRHFRAITTLSPLQFQKRVRLQEARQKLLTLDMDAARVAFEVGYESASQFSREYRRLFGAPPGQDSSRMRSGLAASTRRTAVAELELANGSLRAPASAESEYAGAGRAREAAKRGGRQQERK